MLISIVREPPESGPEKNVHGILEEIHVSHMKALDFPWTYYFLMIRHQLLSAGTCSEILFSAIHIFIIKFRKAKETNVFRKAEWDQSIFSFRAEIRCGHHE